MFLQALVNAVFQLVVFTLPPFFWWLAAARKKEGFFSWLGLRRPAVETPKKWAVTLLLGTAALFALGELAVAARGPLAATDAPYKGMGGAAVPAMLVYALVQTSLSEEILFRGFLLKRLAARFGFARANAVQAILFGLIHLLMVWGRVGFWAGVIIAAYPAAVAAGLAWLNEKQSGGSILPGWIVHGLLNTLSGLLAVF